MVYLVIVILFLLLLYRQERNAITYKNKNRAVFLAYIVMLLFIGFRGHLYSDFISYYYFFDDLKPINHLLENFEVSYFEPGFIIYSTIIKTIIPNYHVWVIINTAIDLLILFWFFKRYTGSYILPLIVFLAYNGLFWECNLYRNIKGLEFFLLSIPTLENNNKTKFVLLNLLGVSFHSSSILYLLLWPIYYRRLSTKILLGLALFANCIFLFQIPIIEKLFGLLGSSNLFSLLKSYEGYAEGDHLTGYALSLGYFERLLTFVVFLSFRNSIVSHDKKYNLFFNCYFLYYIFYLLFYESFTLVQRGPLMFNFSIWILYSVLLLNINPHRNDNEFILFSSIVSLRYHTVLKYLLVVVMMAELYTLKPVLKEYDNLIWGIESFEIRRDKIGEIFNKSF